MCYDDTTWHIHIFKSALLGTYTYSTQLSTTCASHTLSEAWHTYTGGMLHCSILQHAATHCNTLQHAAVTQAQLKNNLHMYEENDTTITYMQ